MRKSVTKRIRFTKNGKAMRRAMGQGHNRSRRSATQGRRKKLGRNLYDGAKIFAKYQG